MGINKLKAALKKEYGKPSLSWETNIHKNEQANPGCIFVYYPEDDLVVSSIILIGHSVLKNANSVELVLDVEGTFTEAEYKSMANFLVKLVEDTDAENVRKGKIISAQVDTLPINPAFNNLIFSYWSGLDVYISYDKKDVLLLEASFINEAEKNILLDYPEALRLRFFHKISSKQWQDQKRTSFEQQVLEFLDKYLKKYWASIGKWYQKNTPNRADGLKSGANQKQIEKLEKGIQQKLPLDFKKSLEIHNGELDINDGYRLMNTEEIQRTWRMLNEILKEGTFDNNKPHQLNEKVQATWWNNKWIPFAEDSGGNLICIDLAPGLKGTKGQILFWEKHEGPVLAELTSFLDWLSNYHSFIRSPNCNIDEEGFIYS